MAKTINDFISTFKTDIARQSRFDVNIPIPLTLLPLVGSARNLQYRCEAAQLPGRTFAPMEQKTYGPVEKHPYLTTYSDIDLTFIVSGDMNEKLFFDLWFDYINPMFNYNMEYKSDYSTILTVNQYDVSNQLTYSVNLFDAFPISMNQLDLDWNNENQHKLVVTFAYTYWQNNSLEAIALQLAEAGISGIAAGIGGLGGSATAAMGTSFNTIPNSLQTISYK